MNDVDVSRQIQQMVRFIRQEAEEKANEISVSAEEEFNIEKLQIVEAEKKKIRQEYERKEKQVDVRKKIFHPTVMDSVVKNAQKLNTSIALVSTVLGQPTLNLNAPCAQGATVVGHSLVNPRGSSVDLTVVGQLAVCAQGATVVGQQAVNPNLSVAQGATVVVQHAVNPDPSGAHGATSAGQQAVNPDTSSAQQATIVGQQMGNPDLTGPQGAMVMGQHVLNPYLSGAPGAMIVGQQAVNCDATGAQEAMVVGQHAINPNLLGTYGAPFVVQQAPLVYSVVPTTLVPVNHAQKPEKFNGSNFSCWQQKMMFYLTTLNLSRFIKEDGPVVTAESDQQTRMVVDAWNNSDYLCKNYVLNCLVDSLYDVYSSKRTTKELWDSLDFNYRTEYAGAKISIVGCFLDYKMVDSKTVISQVQELQAIFHELHAKGMIISESFQVAAIIEKLPFGWNEFKNRLKHKRKEMSIEDLILRLHIEEDNKRSGKKFNVSVKDDIVKKSHRIKFKKNNTGKGPSNVGKGSKLGLKGRILKTQKLRKGLQL